MTPKRTDDSSENFRRLVEQESLVLAATENICDMLEKQGMTRADLAREIGRTRGFVTQLLSGERNMTLHTLSDLAFAARGRVTLSWEPLDHLVGGPEIRDEQWEKAANVARAVQADPTIAQSGFKWSQVVPAYARYKSSQTLEKRNVQPPKPEKAATEEFPEDSAAA